jgi:hypothetical protein
MSPKPEKSLPSGMPDCLKKRRLLNEKELSPDLCREYGEKFLALEWWEDALEFFQKGNCREGLEKIKAYCLESGDAFLLGRLGKNLDQDLWRQVAEKALALGKAHFARRALEMAGDTEKAAALNQQPPGEQTLH